MEILLLATLASVALSYYDKKGVISGMSKLQYIFLKMLALIPFCFILFLFYPFQFVFHPISILLIVALLLVNMTNYLGFIGVVKKTSPYETGVLLTLTIPFIYFIDILIGTQALNPISIVFLALVILGVIIISKNEINIKEFKWSLVLSVFSNIAKGYLIHFLLNYLSIPVYLLVVHVVTALVIYIFFNQKLNVKTLTKSNFKWAFTTQFIGIISLVCNALLAQISVSYYMLRTPFMLISLVLSSYFIKNKTYGEKPSTKKLIGAIITIAGVLLFLIY